MNSAKGSAQIRRNAIILNTPGAHPKDAEKGRAFRKRREKFTGPTQEIPFKPMKDFCDSLAEQAGSRDRAGLPKPMTK
jgi:hypothetical protein